MTKKKVTGIYQDHEDAYIRAAYSAKSVSEIAERLGRTRSSVGNRITFLGLTKKKPAEPHRTRCSIFFDDLLLATIKAEARESGSSLSTMVESLVRTGLGR